MEVAEVSDIDDLRVLIVHLQNSIPMTQTDDGSTRELCEVLTTRVALPSSRAAVISYLLHSSLSNVPVCSL